MPAKSAAIPSHGVAAHHDKHQGGGYIPLLEEHLLVVSAQN